MVEIDISESAYQDMLDIEEYISKDSPTIARSFINKIFNRLEVLYDFPESGRIVPEFNDKALRELILGSYRIVYRIYSETEIAVLRILHGKRIIDISIL